MSAAGERTLVAKTRIRDNKRSSFAMPMIDGAMPKITWEQGFALLRRRYRAFFQCGQIEQKLLQYEGVTLEAISALADISTSESPTFHPRVLISGWACRYRVLRDGRRVIVSFLLPGDVISASRQNCAFGELNISTIAPCTIANFNLSKQLNKDSSIADTLDGLMYAAYVREQHWLIECAARLCGRAAYARAANLVCEMHWRLDEVGLANGGQFSAPLTRMDFADALGISVVHVSRVMRELRTERLVKWRNQEIAILKTEHLRELAEFIPPQ